MAGENTAIDWQRLIAETRLLTCLQQLGLKYCHDLTGLGGNYPRRARRTRNSSSRCLDGRESLLI